MSQSNSYTEKSQPLKASDKKQQKIPRKITATYLHNSGLYYLERFSSSSTNFREVMRRKAKRSCMHHTEQNYDECCIMIDELVEKFIKAELLNDSVYARAKVSALRRKGKSKRAIETYLKSKGLENTIIIQELQHFDEENFKDTADAELQSARTLVRKKRIGPHRPPLRTPNNPEDLMKLQQKELGRMARAGFSFEISKRVLNEKEEDNEDRFYD